MCYHTITIMFCFVFVFFFYNSYAHFTARDAVLKTLLVMCTFIGLCIFLVVLCCRKAKQGSTCTESPIGFRDTESHESEPHFSQSIIINQKLMIHELNEHIHKNADGRTPVLVPSEVKNESEGLSSKQDAQLKWDYSSGNQREKRSGMLKSYTRKTSRNLLSPALDVEVPELPRRSYLTDIDFVTQEYDLIFSHPPEVPKRYNTYERPDNVIVDDKFIMSHSYTNLSNQNKHPVCEGQLESGCNAVSMIALTNKCNTSSLRKTNTLSTQKIPLNLSKAYSKLMLHQQQDKETLLLSPLSVERTFDPSLSMTYWVKDQEMPRKAISHQDLSMSQRCQQPEEKVTYYHNIGAVQKRVETHRHAEAGSNDYSYQPLLLKYGECSEDNMYMKVSRSLFND